MGSYNTAVLTTAGQALLASAIAGGDAVTFSKFQTSSYQYASTTDLAALTYLNDVEQEVAPSGGGVTGDTTIYSSATVTSENVALEYENYTVGLFASDGENEVLFAVSTAITPDVIPADDGTTPSTYTYTMSIGVSTTEGLVIEVSPTVYLTKGSVIDSLTSPTTDQPLSANQGRVLKQMIDDGAKALKVDYVGAETTKAYPENEVIYYSNKFYKVIKEGGLPANYTIVPATDLDDAGLDPETIVTINGIPANGIINASDITFDNTGTGMAATNVQGAVTELNSNIMGSGTTFTMSVNAGDVTSSESVFLNWFVPINKSFRVNSILYGQTDVTNDFTITTNTNYIAGKIEAYTWTKEYANKTFNLNVTIR